MTNLQKIGIALALSASAVAIPTVRALQTSQELSDRQIRQRLAFAISQLRNSMRADSLQLNHLQLSYDAIHARIVRDSLNGINNPPSDTVFPARDSLQILPEVSSIEEGDSVILWGFVWRTIPSLGGSVPTICGNDPDTGERGWIVVSPPDSVGNHFPTGRFYPAPECDSEIDWVVIDPLIVDMFASGSRALIVGLAPQVTDTLPATMTIGDIVMVVGQMAEFPVQVLNANGDRLSLPASRFLFDPRAFRNDVVTVDSTGTIVAVREGQTYLYASLLGTRLTARGNVVVNPIDLPTSRIGQ